MIYWLKSLPKALEYLSLFLEVITITPLAALEPHIEAAAASFKKVMFSISSGFKVDISNSLIVPSNYYQWKCLSLKSAFTPNGHIVIVLSNCSCSTIDGYLCVRIVKTPVSGRNIYFYTRYQAFYSL